MLPETRTRFALYAELLREAVTVPDESTERLCRAACDARIAVVMGINERNRDASNTSLFNSLLFIDADGRLLGVHRKLVPTMGERLVHAMGDGSTLDVYDTALGRISGLICWENYMPLARHALYCWGMEVLAVPAWDRGEPWLSTLRHVAKEGRVYVIGCGSATRLSDIPDRLAFKALLKPDDAVMSRSVMTTNVNATLPSGIHHEGPSASMGELREADMLARVSSLVILAVLAGVHSVGVTANSPSAADPGALTVHEWGTFTTVAGPNGFAIDWLPLGGPTDLPCFVEHFQNRRDIKVAPNQPLPVDYATARSSLWGKVRMETPVLYFYAPRATTVNVRVTFPRGLMTEWYPRASVAQQFVDPNAVRNPRWASTIAWPNVNVTPGASPSFPSGEGASHYYAARNTEAAPLTVNGQHERFLFYRGVASFDVPISAAVLADGAIQLRNLGPEQLTGVVLFQNHHGAIRYRVLGTMQRETTVRAPSRGGSVADLRRELEQLLVTAGLYPKEATAMVDSWRDSWFEEGTRVFYFVPPRAIDAILPLAVTPAPTTTKRVFVGRMELITPEIQASVEKAILSADTLELQRYGRFLGPITDRILATNPTATERQQIGVTTTAIFASFVRRSSTCE